MACGREDGATPLAFGTAGSAQNPCFAPDDDRVLFTHFRTAYNEGPADLVVGTLATSAARTLVADGNDNINLPGAAWNDVTGRIVFTSSRPPHDEVFAIDDEGAPGDEWPVTGREGLMAFEPSLSPDGTRVVFESHVEPAEGVPDDPEDLAAGPGAIALVDVDEGRPAGVADVVFITDGTFDDRQPNWSPAGDLIVFQRRDDDGTHLWVADPDQPGSERPLTSGEEEETDASFSADGQLVVYSGSVEDEERASVFVIGLDGEAPIRVTRSAGYDGAPSFSHDGRSIAFESSDEDPDGSMGTSLLVIDVP